MLSLVDLHMYKTNFRIPCSYCTLTKQQTAVTRVFPYDYRRNTEIVKHLSELVLCVASQNRVVLKGYLYSTVQGCCIIPGLILCAMPKM